MTTIWINAFIKEQKCFSILSRTLQNLILDMPLSVNFFFNFKIFMLILFIKRINSTIKGLASNYGLKIYSPLSPFAHEAGMHSNEENEGKCSHWFNYYINRMAMIDRHQYGIRSAYL